jgi:SAM-dependent methyltransferase
MVISIDNYKGVACPRWFLLITGDMIMSNGAVKTVDFSELIQTDVSSLGTSSSVQRVISRFGTKHKAQQYASGLVGTATDRREKKCIAKALENVSRGTSVLDLPCGNGRLLPLLKKLGYKVTAADSSVHMVAMARHYMGPLGENCIDETDEFQVANILQTDFENDFFDAVVCNRLFHHFPKAEVRQQALKELRRICKGPIVVSFFCNLAYDALTFFLKNKIGHKQPNDRIPISCNTFAEDAQEAGLVVEKWIPMRPLISRQWYAVLKRC